MTKNSPFTPQSDLFPQLSHRVRQPLNQVVEAVAALGERTWPKHQLGYISAVRRAADDMSMLVNDILDLTRIEEGNFRLLPANFDLRSALETTAETLRRRAAEDGRALTVRIHPEIPVWVWGDPGRVRHVIANLVSAILRGTRSAALFLDVELDSDTSEEKRVAVTLDDPVSPPTATAVAALTGRNVEPPAGSDPIAYVQLRLAKALADMMGGSVSIDADDGHGGAYRAHFILQRHQPIDDVEETSPIGLMGARVAVAEEEPVAREELSKLFRQWGCVVTEVASAEDARRRILEAHGGQEPFQLLVLAAGENPQVMEDLGRSLKADSRFAALPMIYIAGSGRRGDAARLRAIGFDAYLTRPLYDRYLRDCLSMALARGVDGDAEEARPLITRHSLREREKARRRCLVADADSLHQLIVARSLEKLGARVDIVETWEEAQRKLDGGDFDLAFVSTALVDDAVQTRIARRSKETNIPWPPLVAIFDPSLQAEKLMLGKGFKAALPRPASPTRLAEIVAKFDPEPTQSPRAGADLRDAKDAIMRELGDLLGEFGEDKELLREVGEHFRADVEACWSPLAKAIETKNTEAFLPLADKMLASSYAMGIPHFQRVFEALMDAGRHGRWGSATRGLQHARRLFGLIEQWLKSL